MHRPAVRLRRIGKIHPGGERALHDVTLDLAAGSFTALMGVSGSGKSTLLQCAAGLDRPTSGEVELDGVALAGLSDAAITRLRRRRVGFVFQSYNLMPTLTVADNVTLPSRLDGRRPDRRAVRDVLARVGLAGHAGRLPDQLSGGEQQRVAVARALIARPGVVFADEPTGALDLVTGREVLHLLRDAVLAAGTTVVMATHDPVAAAAADTVVFLAAGRVAGHASGLTAASIADRVTALAAAAA